MKNFIVYFHVSEHIDHFKAEKKSVKKTEIVWFFTKQGGRGEVPPNQTISGFFTELFIALK